MVGKNEIDYMKQHSHTKRWKAKFGGGVLKRTCSKEFGKIHRKSLLPASLF